MKLYHGSNMVIEQIAFKENGAIKTDFLLKEKQCLNVFKR